MKIIYSIGCPFNFPGLGKTAYYQTVAIKDLGIDLKVFTPCYDRKNLEDIELRSFPLNPILGKLHGRIYNYYYKDLIFDNWVAKNIKGETVDIFWGWSGHCLNTLNLLRGCKDKPITILERQSLEVMTQKRYIENEYRRIGLKFTLIPDKVLDRNIKEQNLSDYFMVNSNFIAESYLNVGFSSDQIKVNPLGVDTNRFTHIEQYENEIFRVIYVGLITVRKGIHRLIDVWKKINLKNSELLLVGRYYPKERKYFNKIFNNCPNLIHINGTAKPEEYYKKSSIFVMPSIEDGFPSVVLEALSVGLPAIVSNRVGSKECVINGVNGFIYDFDNSDELADKILFFYKNRENIKKFGESTREYIGKYSWDNYIKRTKNILNEIITK